MNLSAYFQKNILAQRKNFLAHIGAEGEVAFFSAKHWDRRSRAELIESATPCHDAQVVGLYRDSNPLRLTILAAMSEDYTTAPQHLPREALRRWAIQCLIVRCQLFFGTHWCTKLLCSKIFGAGQHEIHLGFLEFQKNQERIFPTIFLNNKL